MEIVRSPETDPNAGWSPDGNLLYFSSDRDGYKCLWAQRLDPIHQASSRHIIPGAALSCPVAIHGRSVFLVSPSLAQDKIIVSLEERSGGIWMLQLQH